MDKEIISVNPIQTINRNTCSDLNPTDPSRDNDSRMESSWDDSVTYFKGPRPMANFTGRKRSAVATK
jgi:hypothetical protein